MNIIKQLLIVTALLLSACVPSQQQGDAQQPSEFEPKSTQNTTIALLGATGMAGGFIVQEALARGYKVKALARTPENLQPIKDRLTIIEGDARDPLALARLLEGSDVVISALGPVKADGIAADSISYDATKSLLRLMPAYHIQRYIVVSGAAVTTPADDRSFSAWLLLRAANIGLTAAVIDKQAEYQLLTDSVTEWTLVRCPLIRARDFVHPAIASVSTTSSLTLRAGELARFVIDQIQRRDFINQAPFLSSR